ncbi:MAG TPA: acetate--CoA ligase family protein [Thermoanaerobaculia bacterium]|jgi:acetyl coenzyme A synthetase (ADP forming)-like protein
MEKAARHGLDPIFSPRSVAVVGASRRPDSIGFALLHNLVDGGFNGAVYPVNPNAAVVHSIKCYPSLTAIPDPVDLAMIVVPRDLVAAAVDECVAKPVGGLVVITAGFAETGEEGARLEREIRRKVREAGIRMIGPNCMGVVNTDPDVRLDATFAAVRPRRGALGFVSQSGALGVAILNVADSLGLGLTQFASMGNKADVSGNDLLEYWETSEATRVIAMYLESFGNPRRFTEIAKRVGRGKPILVVKSGRTAEGARAATSHTGALAGADLTVSTFLDHCGVLRVGTIAELFDTARAFDRCPLPQGRRVAVVTNAGGPGIMATDACVNLGLEMAVLADATRAVLARNLPPEASVLNPVDMIASATGEKYEMAVRAVLDDPGVDMALVIHVRPLLANPIDVLESVAVGAAEHGEKPLLSVIMATEEFYEEVKLRPNLPLVYRFPEPAARALATLCRYAEWRRRPLGAPAPEYDVDDGAVARLLAKPEDSGGGYLAPDDAFRVLELYGIPVARRRVAADAGEAVAAAREIGFPVVVKAIAPDLVHKSEVGGVALGLAGAAEVERAVDDMAARLAAAGHAPRGYLVQETVRGGHEVVFGISTDPRFGPLLMFGLGGKYVEVFKDVRFGVTPLRVDEAGEMIRGIRGWKLLEGTRGEPPADVEVLREVLLRLAQLVQRHPSITELDVNPFLAAPERAAAKALDVRIRVGAGERLRSATTARAGRGNSRSPGASGRPS